LVAGNPTPCMCHTPHTPWCNHPNNTIFGYLRECIQKFPGWPPGARTANGTAPCH
jgi:hypothetical protein